jgi:predicted nucleotidyltransferase
MAERTITWLLYHEPIDLFLRTANAFSKEIAQLTQGRLKVDVYTIKEYADKFKNGAEFILIISRKENVV